MIESSFLKQYGVRLRGSDISWSEFSTLLHGIMPDTPLGQIVDIRSETDKDTLKRFSPQQHKIRNAWRRRQSEEIARSIDPEQGEKVMRELEQMFAKAFGGKK